MRTLIALVLTASLFGSCSKDVKNMPPASGGVGDIFLVMDSLQWRGPLGRTLDSAFNAEMPGLPRKEARFKMRWIDPRKLNFVLKQSRNLIFVFTLDQKTSGSRILQGLFTPESIEKIKSQPDNFLASAKNVFAKNQEVMYLTSPQEQHLLSMVKKNLSKLTDHFDLRERERLGVSLFKAGQVSGVSDVLKNEYQCYLKIPFGYKLADKQPDFVWLRQINPKDDKDIFIARKKYTTPAAFELESLVRFRDDMLRHYIFEDPEIPDTYFVTERAVPFIPVTADTINFNNHFAVRLRGIWRSNTFGMGGPFQGYALVDEANQQFYYIEGFTFSPGRNQREIMRELETILHSFRTSTELPKP
ncbi:MAG TPA: DUF4837 family protein [Cyclobacteriaceae bacterium]|nr:DUF4837 family protein [Cyclobacteriaceae bacterium]